MIPIVRVLYITSNFISPSGGIFLKLSSRWFVLAVHKSWFSIGTSHSISTKLSDVNQLVAVGFSGQKEVNFEEAYLK